MGLINTIAKAFSGPNTGHDEFATMAHAAERMRDYQKAAIAKAHEAAEARAVAQQLAPDHPDARPNLEDYRLACESMGHTKEWNPSTYAKLNGQDLSGFKISNADFLNQDSDGACCDFYSNIDFTGANLKNCYVQPATSFNEELAKAKTLEGITFDGMGNDDVFTFRSGQYDNITLKNVTGGQIVFASNTQVNNLEISGQSASIAVEPNASISHIRVSDEFRIVTLDMGKGSIISHSDLSNATIDMASNLEGSKWQDVKLSSNLKHVDFTGATLTNVTITGEVEKASLTGVDFTGATLHNLRINDKLITSEKQLREYLPAGTLLKDVKISASEDLIRAEKVQDALTRATDAVKDVADKIRNPNLIPTSELSQSELSQSTETASAQAQPKEKSYIPPNYYAPNQGRGSSGSA